MRRKPSFALVFSATLAVTSATSAASVFLIAAVSEGTTSAGNYISLYDWHA